MAFRAVLSGVNSVFVKGSAWKRARRLGPDFRPFAGTAADSVVVFKETRQIGADSAGDSGQGELFGDDYSQPDANKGEPMSWSANGGQDFLDNDFVQVDAPDCAG